MYHIKYPEDLLLLKQISAADLARYLGSYLNRTRIILYFF